MSWRNASVPASFTVNGAMMASEASLLVGGVKNSGWGRSGHDAIEDLTELRLTALSQGSAAA